MNVALTLFGFRLFATAIMSQQESSKRNKGAKNKTYAKPGSLSFLANKKRRLLTTNEIVQAIESEKGHPLKLIEQQTVSTTTG
ncbi:hypothetical protein H5410_004134 [Solanum commersonii]|uniref:Uncharacterized protein n=1 Tax=Solanum commersonii TaxID=4109 RepID=A0A9J6B6W6_SOLCO|nr:hypothetical protein H5410_004134 [Solanum commersonii]